MAYTITDYYPPLPGCLDARRLAIFADNRELDWAFEFKPIAAGNLAVVTLDGKKFEAIARDDQVALDLAIDKAVDWHEPRLQFDTCA